MATLQGAIAELVAVVGAVDGVNYYPDEPGEQIPLWPAAMVYMTDGVTGASGNDLKTDKHNIQIAVIMPAIDMRQQAKTMLPLFEPITAALWAHRNSYTSAHYDTFIGIAHSLGPMEWPSGELWYGYVFTLQELKIQNNI